MVVEAKGLWSIWGHGRLVNRGEVGDAARVTESPVKVFIDIWMTITITGSGKVKSNICADSLAFASSVHCVLYVHDLKIEASS